MSRELSLNEFLKQIKETRMKRQILRVSIGLVMVMITACTGGEASLSGSRPNIVLIMADDLGFSDLGVHGNTLVETPRLDHLASESVQFSQFYVTPVCATTRASLLTGRHFLRTGVSHVHGGKDFLHLDEITMADALKRQGYATGMWGKWHSGKTPGYYPWERGFDEAFMAKLYEHKDNMGLMNGAKVATSGWLSEVITDYAIDFIKRKQDQPFFAYLPFLSCHSPLKAPESYISKYREKGLSENLSTLYGMVDQMDENVGRLLDALDEMQLSENTIVIFLSDNGPAVINNLLSDEDRRIRYVNGLRGHKGNIWENGIKSPLFVRWKGSCKPTMVHRLAGVSDLFPTLLELAGSAAQDQANNLDGRSLLPSLVANEDALADREIFLYANPGWPPSDKAWTPEGVKDEYSPWKYSGGDKLLYENQIIGIRNERYKLLLNPGETDGCINPDAGGYVLIDLKNDPAEKENLAAIEPEQLREMEASLELLYEDIYGSEHAFEMPVFKIGSKEAYAYPVLAYAPRTSSAGVKSASGYITNFTTPGDSSCYNIEVEEEGSYNLEVRYHYTGKEIIQFEIKYRDERYLFEILPGTEAVHMSGIHFMAGNASFTLINQSVLEEGKLSLTDMRFTIE